MKTDELVSLLANRTEAVDLRLAVRRFWVAVLAGAAVAALFTMEWLGFRSTLMNDLPVPLFWVKEGFCVALGAAGLAAVARLGRPGSRFGWIWVGIFAPLIVMWLLAAATLLTADAADRSYLVLGHTARVCAPRIAVISIPLFIAILTAMKGLAPTRLRLAGAAVGLAAGSLAALLYSLHCPELEPPFLGLWYVAGMLIPTAVGASAGPAILRW